MSKSAVCDLAAAIDSSELELFRYARNSRPHYHQFSVQKKSGGERKISAPAQGLKRVQRAIAGKLLAPHVEAMPACATGYRRGCSIVANALPHADKDFVFNADIEDFFGSIKTKMVLALFRRLGYGERVAELLSRLTTHEGALPQGAPTSPAIANLICAPLDGRLAQFCHLRNWSYTRYCDDLTISGGGSFASASQAVDEIVQSEGFRLNEKKMRMSRRHGRQMVTGLVVNDRPNLTRLERRRLRAIFHQAALRPELFGGVYNELAGRVAFLQMVRPDDEVLTQYKETLELLRADARLDSPSEIDRQQVL